jgi:hypothetical protein
MPRAKDEKPKAVTTDKAYMPLHCNGNGNRDCQAHAPACRISIPADEPIFLAHWKTPPHITIHCRACRDHFFAPQKKLRF